MNIHCGRKAFVVVVVLTLYLPRPLVVRIPQRIYIYAMECVQYKHRYVIYIYIAYYIPRSPVTWTLDGSALRNSGNGLTNIIRIEHYNTRAMRNVQRRHYFASKGGVGETFIYSLSTVACRSRAGPHYCCSEMTSQ